MNEVEFGYRVRQVLNSGIERLDYKTTFRLERARRLALDRLNPAAAAPVWVAPVSLATTVGPRLDEDRAGPWLWVRRVGLAAPLVALLLGFVGIYDWQSARTIDELAAIDFALLLDEAPVQAYADKGFGVLLGSDLN